VFLQSGALVLSIRWFTVLAGLQYWPLIGILVAGYTGGWVYWCRLDVACARLVADRPEIEIRIFMNSVSMSKK
jgi:hypothetical protein